MCGKRCLVVSNGWDTPRPLGLGNTSSTKAGNALQAGSNPSCMCSTYRTCYAKSKGDM